MRPSPWILALAFAAAPAFATPVCSVVAVKGEASVAAQPLQPDQGLEVGAEIHTGAGRVRLRCVDGSMLVVADHSVLRIARFDVGPDKPRDASLQLEVGLIGQQVAKQPGGSWEVRTPTAVTAVRGTEFMVEVGADLATAVNVQSGQVQVEALQSAAGGGTRSLRPRSIVELAHGDDGTSCTSTQGCSAVKTWTPERVKAAQDRLAF
ncbi:MAG: FecR domain-containing protein [Pelomonas sp.]|nr:FecR domain-containing protein [Roseateles sp.]